MSYLRSYPKVYNLGHAAVMELFKGFVIAEEKVDGSQFSFGLIDSILKFKSHHKDQTHHTSSLFVDGVESIKSIQDKLHPEWTYRGEYLQKPKHNTLNYNRIPKLNTIIFDINTGDEIYLSRKEKEEECKKISLECVPMIACGENYDVTDIKNLLDYESILGGTKIEGLVFKNYSRFGTTGKVLMGKHVSEEFKEVHNKDWKDRNKGSKEIRLHIVEKYRSEARWEKALQHLKEKGELLGEPKDIGALVKEVQTDVLEECKEEIKEILFAWAWPHINRGIVGKLAMWYKDKLLEKQFEETKDVV